MNGFEKNEFERNENGFEFSGENNTRNEETNNGFNTAENADGFYAAETYTDFNAAAQTENADTSAAPADSNVIDAEIVSEHTASGETVTGKTVPFKESIKKKGYKRYIAVAVAAAIVNLSALGGIFALGYGMGRGHIGSGNKEKVVASLKESKSGTSGAKQTVTHGDELTTVEISKKKSSEIEDFISKISEIEKENTYMISRDKQYIEEKILSQLKFPEQETRDSIYDGAILRQYKIWSNFIYDLKRKTFTCKNVEVDSIGRVKSMSFEQK